MRVESSALNRYHHAVCVLTLEKLLPRPCIELHRTSITETRCREVAVDEPCISELDFRLVARYGRRRPPVAVRKRKRKRLRSNCGSRWILRRRAVRRSGGWAGRGLCDVPMRIRCRARRLASGAIKMILGTMTGK